MHTPSGYVCRTRGRVDSLTEGERSGSLGSFEEVHEKKARAALAKTTGRSSEGGKRGGKRSRRADGGEEEILKTKRGQRTNCAWLTLTVGGGKEKF